MSMSLLFYIFALLCFGASAFNAPGSSRFDYFSGVVFFTLLAYLIENGTIAAGS